MSATSALSFRSNAWRVATVSLLMAPLTLPTVAQDYGQQQPYPSQGAYPQPQGDPSQMDPPARVARVSVLQGNVSLQPSGVEDFSPASLNYPLTSGDRIYSDVGSLTELEAGGLAVRLGSGTDLSVTSMTDQLAQFGLGQGSVHIRSYDFDPNSTLEVDTPNVAVTVLAAGDVRVDVAPDGSSTQVTLLSGQARVDGPGFQQQLQPGESLQLTGSEPVYAQDVRRPRGDALDRFSNERDSAFQSSVAMESDYVNPDTIGAADLGQYGDWSNDGDYGAVWYPRGVAVDWQPYSFGHWAYIAPWGWTWVENEPWGFAPFHYGRWARFGPRWGWIPGPRVVRPVYSPALVAFVSGGVGVTAWFPLGPREPYVPWYRTSSLYANRINVTNIYNRNTVEVRNIYNQRTTNIYINNTTVNRVYVNRQVATVAVPQNAFAGGRSVHEVSMHVSPQQFANAPVLMHPAATPTRAIMAPAPARVLPPSINRPPVQSRAPMNNGGSQPGGFNRPVSTGNANGFGNGAGQSARGVAPAQSQPADTRQNPRIFDPVSRPGPHTPGPGASAPGANIPAHGSQFPARGDQGMPPFRGDPNRANTPAPVAPATPNQFPNRGNGTQTPPLRSQPGATIAPASPSPVYGNPLPGRGNGEEQALPLRAQPGRTSAPAPIAPVNQQPSQSNPGQAPRDFRDARDFRNQPGASSVSAPPERTSQPAPANNRQFQQPNLAQPQNQPQAQRFHPQPTPQPAPAPQRQAAPAPKPAPAPAATPKENHPPRDDDKKH